MSDPSGRDETGPVTRDDDERCESTVGAKIRCMLERGHDGLHLWRDPETERMFEWG